MMAWRMLEGLACLVHLFVGSTIEVGEPRRLDFRPLPPAPLRPCGQEYQSQPPR
jgi:hypothetical protein